MGINDTERYIDNIEIYTGQLEHALMTGDKTTFVELLEAISEMAEAIHAKHCIAYVHALLQSAKTRDVALCEPLMRQAVADMLLLSIELQTANRAAPPPLKRIELNEKIAHNLATINRMLRVGNHKDAGDMAEELKPMNDVFDKLSQMIANRQYDRAKEVATTLEKEHIKVITRPSENSMDKTILAVDNCADVLTSVSEALRGRYQVHGTPNGKFA
ncbi:MAG: hypothetical protein FWG45_04155, partial [Oscillospiraceae bacterium]|nr:hypothetical protein [Oscillospiraceae bacterium]